MIKKDLEQQGKLQIEAALKDVDMDLELDIPNKCNFCDYAHYGQGNQYCSLDAKVANAYGCYKELLGNNARVLNPEEDAMDLYKGKFLDEFQQGGH